MGPEPEKNEIPANTNDLSRVGLKAGVRRKDADRMRWLCENLEWDGHGFWFPEICVREMDAGESVTPQPSVDDLRAFIDERLSST